MYTDSIFNRSHLGLASLKNAQPSPPTTKGNGSFQQYLSKTSPHTDKPNYESGSKERLDSYPKTTRYDAPFGGNESKRKPNGDTDEDVAWAQHAVEKRENSDNSKQQAKRFSESQAEIDADSRTNRHEIAHENMSEYSVAQDTQVQTVVEIWGPEFKSISVTPGDFNGRNSQVINAVPANRTGHSAEQTQAMSFLEGGSGSLKLAITGDMSQQSGQLIAADGENLKPGQQASPPNPVLHELGKADSQLSPVQAQTFASQNQSGSTANKTSNDQLLLRDKAWLGSESSSSNQALSSRGGLESTPFQLTTKSRLSTSKNSEQMSQTGVNTFVEGSTAINTGKLAEINSDTPFSFFESNEFSLAVTTEVISQGASARGVESIIARPETARQVAVQLADALATSQKTKTEISLSPDELGRVRITLSTAETGVAVSITAERPETLDMLRRNIDQLAEEFRNLGYSDIEFDFSESQTNANSNEESATRQLDEKTEMDSNRDHADPGAETITRVRNSRGLDLRL